VTLEYQWAGKKVGLTSIRADLHNVERPHCSVKKSRGPQGDILGGYFISNFLTEYNKYVLFTLAEIVGSNSTGDMDVCLLLVFVLSSRDLCDGPIPRPEESYRLWCVSECDKVKNKNFSIYCE
jgi:hypothetical protein